MNHIKVKNLTEKKIEKMVEVFGHKGPKIGYGIDGNIIQLENGFRTTFTKTISDIESFELVKDIKIKVDKGYYVDDKGVKIKDCKKKVNEPFELNWFKDFGTVWIIHPLVGKLIQTVRKSSNGTTMNSETKAKYKEEITRLKASRKASREASEVKIIVPKK